MSEEEARHTASDVLAVRGLRKGWHQVLVRFGPNTTLNFDDPSHPDVVLGDDDIFFVDIGPIHGGCEGDAGDTFAVGDDPDMIRAVTDVWGPLAPGPDRLGPARPRPAPTSTDWPRSGRRPWVGCSTST